MAGSGTTGERELAEALRGSSRAVAISVRFRNALPHGTAEQGLRKRLNRVRYCNNSGSFTCEKTTHKVVQPGDRKVLQLIGEQGNLCGEEGADGRVPIPPLAGAQHCGSCLLSTSCCLLLLSSANLASNASLSITHHWDTLCQRSAFLGTPQ